MKKTLSLCLILVSSLFLSACGVNPDNNSATTTPSDQEEKVATSFSLRDLIAKNIPQKCTWSSEVEGSVSSGTMVIQGNKFKQDVNIKQEGLDLITHSISDGTYIYTWQENSSQVTPNTAIKMKLETVKSSEEDTPSSDYTASLETVDLDQEYQYNCSPTTVSESDFQPPKNIEFSDYDQFLKDIQSNIPNVDLSDFE